MRGRRNRDGRPFEQMIGAEPEPRPKALAAASGEGAQPRHRSRLLPIRISPRGELRQSISAEHYEIKREQDGAGTRGLLYRCRWQTDDFTFSASPGGTPLLKPLSEGCPVLGVEAVYAAEQEMALTLQDFMERRTELMLFDPQHGLDGATQVAELMGDVLGWSRQERERQVALYWQAVARMTSFVSARPSAPAPAEAEQ